MAQKMVFISPETTIKEVAEIFRLQKSSMHYPFV